MKKIFNSLLVALMAIATFSCSDVPSPYDEITGGDTNLTGAGTKENPFDVASAMKKQDNSEAWVMGYIVGAVDDISITESAKFEAPFKKSSNLLIAASKDEKDYKKCLAVQLITGDVRSAINLLDHPENLGKSVILSGKLTKYFGVSGLKEISAAVLDGKDLGGSTGPVEGENPFGLNASNPVNTFSANFEDVVDKTDYALANWTNAFAQGNRKWQGTIFTDKNTQKVDKYIKATAYGTTEGTTFESWFITPAFTVNNVKDKKVLFDCTVSFYVETSNLKVYFLELVNGKMTKTEINLAGIPKTGSYVWAKDLAIDLTPFAGKVGFIGFQYTGLGGKSSSTYCLDNIRTADVQGGGTENPDVNPGEGDANDLSKYKGIEKWTDAFPALFEATTPDPKLSIEKTIKHGGTFSLKHMSPVGTGKSQIQQDFVVTPGKKYKITIWFYDNEPNAKCRLWCSWINTLDKPISFASDMVKEKEDLAKMQYPNNGGNDYFTDSDQWQTYTAEVTAPQNERDVYRAAKLHFELRTYPENKLSGAVYYDDIEVVEVK